MSEADEKEAAAVQKGLQRAFRRLGMVFETSEHYLDFWFPGGNFTLEGLPPDLADYYSYDLERTDGGFVPKASREAAEEDALSILSESPTAAALGGVGCPVALIRAAEGFFPGSEPLVSDKAREAMAKTLDLRSERLLPGANHYTMFYEYARKVANVVDEFVGQLD
jgi:lipase